MPDEQLNQHEIEHYNALYLNQQHVFMRWSAEIEPKKGLMDQAFIERNRNELLLLDKFAPLAYFIDGRERILQKLKMDNMQMEESLGLHDFAEKTVTGALHDIQLSRGNDGFFQKAIITQRHELSERHITETEKKVGIINRLFSGKKQDQQEGNLQ